MSKTYIAIDLKSFYASAECVSRGLDPLDTNLVVADASRTEKTICLAVSPSLKRYGISGRARLFEVVQKMKEVNAAREKKRGSVKETGVSVSAKELDADPALSADYIAAPPRMSYYMQVSNDIYRIYLNYAAPEDIHIYSIDEVFIDVTDYLRTYGLTARELVRRMIGDVLAKTGITATAGIAPNLYLCKAAMDIVAKHIPADRDGVRIAELDERSYRKLLWNHRPLTDFWRVGRGIARKLEHYGMYTMGDVARMSLQNEDLLFKLFGVNAELLIDHAWGMESCTMADIKGYRTEEKSFSSGQVLQTPYTKEKGRIIIREMAEALSLQLVDKKLLTDLVGVYVGYEALEKNGKRRYAADLPADGSHIVDHYGRVTPKPAAGSMTLPRRTNSTKEIAEAMLRLFDQLADPGLLERRYTLTVGRLISEEKDREERENSFEQLDMFTDYAAREKEQQKEADERKKERKVQEAMLEIRKKFGAAALVKGTDLQEGATGIERGRQIGGHKA